MSTQNTRKKMKIIGTEKYIRQSDGTIEDMQVVSFEERDCNFHKIWLEHILSSINIIGNQKTKLAFWIMNNLNKENQLIMTQRQIATKTGMSTKTVTATLKALIDSNFLQKMHSGAYRVNPEILFKGGKGDRLNILFQYRKAESETETESKSENTELNYKDFIKLNPIKLIKLKNNQFWLIRKKDQNIIYTKTNKNNYINFLKTNPTQELISALECALDDYLDAEIENAL